MRWNKIHFLSGPVDYLRRQQCLVALLISRRRDKQIGPIYTCLKKNARIRTWLPNLMLYWESKLRARFIRVKSKDIATCYFRLAFFLERKLPLRLLLSFWKYSFLNQSINCFNILGFSMSILLEPLVFFYIRSNQFMLNAQSIFDKKFRPISFSAQWKTCLQHFIFAVNLHWQKL